MHNSTCISYGYRIIEFLFMTSILYGNMTNSGNTTYGIFLNYRPILKIRLWMIIDDGKYTINNNKYFLSIAGNQFTNANKFLLPTEYWQYVFWACLTYVSHLSFLFISFYVIFVIFYHSNNKEKYATSKYVLTFIFALSQQKIDRSRILKVFLI